MSKGRNVKATIEAMAMTDIIIQTILAAFFLDFFSIPLEADRDQNLCLLAEL
ncbi:MAG: hypothetical protein HY220_01865 [Candidatus Sungbacteria bacterium]|uniref:Uncharacterized protein n=1 Tax=Candidatus Sungiibacteriota bacterium TaxID=2750080 RepID=A0A9D6QVI1_9BACT|nr:hypothetical protein [Candidatus Sungbacteria bacterium]